jgi:hypothetical protein
LNKLLSKNCVFGRKLAKIAEKLLSQLRPLEPILLLQLTTQLIAKRVFRIKIDSPLLKKRSSLCYAGVVVVVGLASTKKEW